MKKIMFRGRELKEPSNNLKSYTFLDDTYYSLREAAIILGKNINILAKQSKYGQIYQTKINNKFFIPSWSIAIEKANCDKIPLFRVFPINTIKYDVSKYKHGENLENVCLPIEDIKHNKFSCITWDDEEILKILKEFDFEATVTKKYSEIKNFVQTHNNLFYMLCAFCKPSILTREILIKLPYVCDIRFHPDVETWNEEIYKENDIAEVQEKHLAKFMRHISITDLSNGHNEIKKNFFMLEPKKLECFKKAFLCNPDNINEFIK